jgi:hypothetical protein
MLIGIGYQYLNSVDIGEEICIVTGGGPLLPVAGNKGAMFFPQKFLTLASVQCTSVGSVDCYVTHTLSQIHTYTHM